MFKQLFAPTELIAISYPGKFEITFKGLSGGTKYLVKLYMKGSKRSYKLALPKNYVKQLSKITTNLDYWVETGYFNSPEYEGAFDWKVSPRDLRKRYLKDLVAD